ncbi:glutathione-dependent formaldehyde-activating enzyme [Colletotrichum karsti]|uniref:Glutathione-dependent formaldehyde-activating enzyme n=1 Tax=Colletotrichum karsti TaxID=1095194 RepID=A0A9P6IGK9_9PEZI|nr:glutathione-dependent formaldehyde-activating enzyme [Colletotrichum karsti]KAF9880206.1 glutathione-dependent formaldehyde-activating enzyme [Colletotrichum karsti]
MAQETNAQAPSASKTLTAQCYCKSVHFNITVPTSALPLKVHLCHCSTCRYTHGTLSTFHARLPSGVAPSFISPSSLSSLTAYRHATATNTRYFCSTCGCHIGDQGINNDDDWVISASIFDANKDDVPSVWDIHQHVNTDSAPGGGLYNWLPSIAGKEINVRNPKTPDAKTAAAPALETGEHGEELLRGQCHCGGVSFTISRPSAGVASYRDWISPTEPGKWMAGADTCGDCRLQTGAHVTGWAFVPQSCIAPRVPGDLTLGTSKMFQSTEKVSRSFCGVCGASVLAFYSGPERALVDGDRLFNLAVGLLRAPEGVLAEDWLTWRTVKVGWAENGREYDAALVEALAEGTARWGEKYGDKGKILEMYP